ncbi:glycosyltransferase family 4 protein [Halobaculum sp. MBLA0147]|uniref:glycosyltransferase family 4 protein n=1 Tax=Halobaculum sp. MBLA0147 TaxID=3079934 RepID=UPI0035255487
MSHTVGFVIVSGEFGGAETVVYNVLDRLSSRRSDLTLFANTVVADEFREIDSLRVVDIGDIPYHSYRSYLGLDQGYAAAQSIIGETCRNEEIDALVYNLPGTLFLRPEHTNLSEIFVMHGAMGFDVDERPESSSLLDRESRSGLRSRLLSAVRRNVNTKEVATVDHVILTCNYFGQLLDRRGVSVERTVIPNGVDPAIVYDRREVVDITEPTVCYIGGARNVKGWDLLVQAIDRLADDRDSLTVYVLRDVPQDHQMRQYLARRGVRDHVEFVGYVDRETYLDYLFSCDVFCLPSYSESIPASALDAVALGKPIVATDVGGTSEVVTHEGNGYLCDPTPSSVAAGIEYFLDDVRRMRRASRASFELVERFCWQTVVDQYERCLRERLTEES